MPKNFHIIGMLSLIACTLLGSIVTSSHADLVSSTGAVTVISPPPDVRFNIGLESDTAAFFFTERTGFNLPSAVSVDITGPGTYNSNASLTPGTIAAGTLVNSYFLHTDAVGSSALNTRIYTGSMTFNTDIIGVIVLSPQLTTSTAILGHPGTVYDSVGQGIELGSPEDTVTISGRTLSFSFLTNLGADDIRIVTSVIVTSVPEPLSSTLMLIGLGALGLRARMRRRDN